MQTDSPSINEIQELSDYYDDCLYDEILEFARWENDVLVTI